MNTHPHICAQFVTDLDTTAIIEAVVSDAFTGREWLVFRAVLLAELAYRLGVRSPGFPERIWREVFGTYGRPVAQGFRSPSESWPASRGWAH
jgi:hypothetical protein